MSNRFGYGEDYRRVDDEYLLHGVTKMIKTTTPYLVAFVVIGFVILFITIL